MCAGKELEQLGVELDARYVQALRTTLQHRRKRRKPAEPAPDAIPDGYGSEGNDTFAFIAGFTAGGAPYGVTWEEMADLEEPQAGRGRLTPDSLDKQC